LNKEDKFYFIKQLDFANRHFTFRECPYYPCHKFPAGQDDLNCLFCFCPFYPCNGKIGTGNWKEVNGKKIYDCSNCNFIHRNEIVFRIIELFYKGRGLKKIKSIIKKEFVKNEKER